MVNGDRKLTLPPLREQRPDLWWKWLEEAKEAHSKCAPHTTADPIAWLLETAGGINNYIIRNDAGEPVEINTLLTPQHLSTMVQLIKMGAWSYYRDTAFPAEGAKS